MTACKLNDPEFMSSIADTAVEKNRQELDAKEEAFLSTLPPEQRKLYFEMEGLVTDDMNRVQDATVRALWCPRCRVKSCQEAA